MWSLQQLYSQNNLLCILVNTVTSNNCYQKEHVAVVTMHLDSSWPAGYMGLILHNTAVATASRSTIEGTMRVLCSYCMHCSLSSLLPQKHQSTLIIPSTVLRLEQPQLYWPILYSQSEESGCDNLQHCMMVFDMYMPNRITCECNKVVSEF